MFDHLLTDFFKSWPTSDICTWTHLDLFLGMCGHNLITDPENGNKCAKQPAKATVAGFEKAEIVLNMFRGAQYIICDKIVHWLVVGRSS